MKGKIYTIEELNSALPLVRAIVADIVDGCRSLQRELVRLKLGNGDGSPLDQDLLRELPWDVRDLVDEVRGNVDELGELGIFLVDPESGLVEAYGSHDGDIVYLSWQPGEERVSFWHGLFASPRERKSVRITDVSEAARA